MRIEPQESCRPTEPMFTCARVSTTLSLYRKRGVWLITHTIKPSNYIYRDIHRSKPFSPRVLKKNGRGFFQLKTKKKKKKKKRRGALERVRRVLARWFTCLLTNTRDEGLERVPNCTSYYDKEQFFVGRILFLTFLTWERME